MNLRSILVPGFISLTAPAIATAYDASEQLTEFMNFNKLEARIRLVDFLREDKDTNDKSREKAGGTGLGVQMNFKSGWFADVIGFDASLYTVGNMSSPYDSDRDLFVTTSCSLDCRRHTGFSKLGQAYVKAKLQLDDEEPPVLTFKGGRERIYTGLIAGSGSRSIPSSWQGIDIGGSFAGLDYGFAWVDKVSKRNSSNFEKFQSFKKTGSSYEEIDSIWGMEIGYELMGFSVSYKDAHAKDFLYSYNFNAGYTLNVSPDWDIGLNFMYYKAKEDGKLWTGRTWDNSFNKDANIKHINITTDFGDLTLLLGYSKTEASYKDDQNNKQLGKYYYDYGRNTYGGFLLPTSPLIGDFFYDGEKAWVISAAYDFSQLTPGLSAEVSYTSGDGFKNGGNSLKEKETDLDIKYAFQGSALDGLSFRFRYGMYRPDSKLKPTETSKNERRVYLEYKSMVF